MEDELSKLINFLNKDDYELKSFLKEEGVGPILLTNAKISDGLKFHIDNNIPLTSNIFRKFSDSYFELLKEAKKLFKSGELIVSSDSEWLLDGNFGEFGEIDGNIVPLDFPMAIEEEISIIKNSAEYKGKKVNLNKPRYLRKGDPGYGRKQYVVYVKDGDKVKRITFGDPDLKSKPSNPKARKSFRARHKCDQKKDKTTPGYWSCRYPPNW